MNARILPLSALGVVIVALAVLQYRSIDAVSKAHEAQTRSILSERVKTLSDALDTEITRAALVFEVPPAPEASVLQELEEGWTAWTRRARWPGIVAGLAFVTRTEGQWRIRTMGSAAVIDPAAGSA